LREFQFLQTPTSPPAWLTDRAIGSFLFGYDSGIIGSVISDSYTEFHSYFKNPGPNVTGAVVSVFAGGAFCMSTTQWAESNEYD